MDNVLLHHLSQQIAGQTGQPALDLQDHHMPQQIADQIEQEMKAGLLALNLYQHLPQQLDGKVGQLALDLKHHHLPQQTAGQTRRLALDLCQVLP